MIRARDPLARHVDQLHGIASSLLPGRVRERRLSSVSANGMGYMS